MGRIKHNAIIVTCGQDIVSIVWDKANEVFESKVTNIVSGVSNDYFSFLIVPDGSKEGWNNSDKWDSKRDYYFKWLEEYELTDSNLKGIIGTYVDCIEVYFGGDDEIAHIVRTNNY